MQRSYMCVGHAVERSSLTVQLREWRPDVGPHEFHTGYQLRPDSRCLSSFFLVRQRHPFTVAFPCMLFGTRFQRGLRTKHFRRQWNYFACTMILTVVRNALQFVPFGISYLQFE